MGYIVDNYTRILGSSLSRKKSPRMLKLITVMLMAMIDHYGSFTLH